MEPCYIKGIFSHFCPCLLNLPLFHSILPLLPNLTVARSVSPRSLAEPLLHLACTCVCVYVTNSACMYTHTLTLIGRSNNPPAKGTCPLQYHAPPLVPFFTDTGSNSGYSFNDLLVPGTMLGFGFAHLTDSAQKWRPCCHPHFTDGKLGLGLHTCVRSHEQRQSQGSSWESRRSHALPFLPMWGGTCPFPLRRISHFRSYIRQSGHFSLSPVMPLKIMSFPDFKRGQTAD